MELFSIGRVFSRAFGLIRETLPSVGLFTLILIGIEAVLGMVLQPMMLESMETSMAGTNPGLAMFSSSFYWFSVVFTLFALGLGWAGALHGLLTHARKGSSDLAMCFQAGFAWFLPTLGLIILWWLGVAVGWMFIVIPALILISMWAVAVPAMIGEGIGVFDSFGRSRFLTRGHRLSIFGVLFLLAIAYYVLAFMIAGTALGGAFLSGKFDLQEIGEMGVAMILISIPVSWVSGMLIKAMVVSLYLETVLVKEGVRTDDLTEVFD